MSFRWVILGAGAIAEKFADAVRRIDDAEVIGVLPIELVHLQ